MAYFASSVKSDWTVDVSALLNYVELVTDSAQRSFDIRGYWDGPLTLNSIHALTPERSKLLLKDSISPLPLHKTLVLLSAIDEHGDHQLQRFGRMALAKALVGGISNLKFGPEVGLGKIKDDAPVLELWFDCMYAMIHDILLVQDRSDVPVAVFRSDARQSDTVLEPDSVDAVITSPPYPNEKDYTRTTRLESVILGLIGDRRDLRSLKQDLIRSNTRGVYKSDNDDLEVAHHAMLQEVAKDIEIRRIKLGKTSGFERQYARVTLLYFGGMARHLASLRAVLRPGAKLAYVVGDQASYLRVMIRTGQLVAEIARSLGYQLNEIDLFRTRQSTTTGEQLREEVVLLEWPGY